MRFKYFLQIGLIILYIITICSDRILNCYPNGLRQQVYQTIQTGTYSNSNFDKINKTRNNAKLLLFERY